jgi:hypothetical protein
MILNQGRRPNPESNGNSKIVGLTARHRPCRIFYFAGLILEPFKKYCSHAVETLNGAVFLIFGFVSAQSQVAADMLLRQSPAKNQKASLSTATVFFKRLQTITTPSMK